MNRYILIRRLRGPAILLLIGVIALLHQADLANWSLLVPLLLILIGLLKLAERAALAVADDIPAYPGAYPGAPYPYGGAAPMGAQTPAQTGSSIVPAASESGKGPEGGMS
jgi:hypothetical protein